MENNPQSSDELAQEDEIKRIEEAEHGAGSPSCPPNSAGSRYATGPSGRSY